MARDGARGVGGAQESVSDRQPAPACPCGYSYAAHDPSGVACPSCGKVRPLLVQGVDVVPVGERTNTELWRAASWASSWYLDALAEAQHEKGDLNARRREILFAICSIESYLYEWTRGVVGPHEVDEYFPPGSKAGIRDKWKDGPKELAAKQKIRAAPSLGGSDWVEFRQLVTYRDGLVHANASRATSDAKPDALPPVPSPDDLLCLDGERREREAKRESEPDQPHGAPRWRMAGGESSRRPRCAPAPRLMRAASSVTRSRRPRRSVTGQRLAGQHALLDDLVRPL